MHQSGNQPPMLDSTASSSGEKSPDCRFCAISGRSCRDPQDDAPWDTVLFESPNFYVMPTLGALLEGWLLVISKRHYLCVGDMPITLVPELNEMISKTVGVVRENYCSPTIFEHGPHNSQLDLACGTAHLHIHVVPLGFQLLSGPCQDSELVESRWISAREDYAELRKCHDRGNSYLYLREPSRQSLFCVPELAKSQIFRRAIARRLGVASRYDYRQHPFTENVDRMVSRLRHSRPITTDITSARVLG